jgi:hypothetical protein
MGCIVVFFICLVRIEYVLVMYEYVFSGDFLFSWVYYMLFIARAQRLGRGGNSVSLIPLALVG